MSIPKIDFAGDTVPVFDATTGTELRAHVFVAVLGASNYTYAEARWDWTMPATSESRVTALTSIPMGISAVRRKTNRLSKGSAGGPCSMSNL